MRQWYALRSKPRRESAAALLLAGAGIETYAPQVKVNRAGGRSGLDPFFPGYLFARLDLEQGEVRLASYTRGILYVVGYGGQPCPVPDHLILALQARLEEWPAAGFQRGDRLVITSGPLKGIEALFETHLSPNGRVRVLIEILDRWCQAVLHVSQVRRTEAASPGGGRSAA